MVLVDNCSDWLEAGCDRLSDKRVPAGGALIKKVMEGASRIPTDFWGVLFERKLSAVNHELIQLNSFLTSVVTTNQHFKTVNHLLLSSTG